MQTPNTDKFSDREIHDMCEDLAITAAAHDYENHTRALRAALERAVTAGFVLLKQDEEENWIYEQAAK